jgi:hypothetical protein
MKIIRKEYELNQLVVKQRPELHTLRIAHQRYI